MALDRQKKLAVLGRTALMLTALIWGTSFVVLKNTLDAIPTLYVLAFRFSGAAVLIALVFIKQLKTLDKRYFRDGLILGVLLFLAYTIQTYGLYHTTPSKNAFLTAAYCVLVPFVTWIMWKKRPDKFHFISAALCLAGVGFVSLKNDSSIEFGDLLTLCSSVFYAVHIILTGKYVKNRSVPLLIIIQFATAGSLAWIAALLTDPFPTQISAGNIWSLVYLCVLCSAVCFLLQTFGQKHTAPAAAAIILSLESVFGAAFSVIISGEQLSAKLLLGFVLIFVAVLTSETKLSFLKKRPAVKVPAGETAEAVE
jgi:drug/metabolite transporter (DMT)-like permease